MENNLFYEYSKRHVHFYDESIPALLEKAVSLALSVFKEPNLVDLGCGDGRLLYALYRRRLLSNFGEVVAVDISKERIERLRKSLPFVKGLVSDALNVRELLDSSFDLVICSQLIEHVQDDKRLVLEIRRLLKVGGLAYISSVVKRKYGFYFYVKDGCFRLDPSHVREYSSKDEFLDLFRNSGFEILNVKEEVVMFPMLDMIVRVGFRVGFLMPDVEFYEQHPVIRKFRKLRVPVIGYKTVEVMLRKNEG